MADIKPGDRVRFSGEDEVLEVIAMQGDLAAVSSIPKDPAHRPIVLHTANLELVEVAHYAPPSVPMVAMTPDRIAAVQAAVDYAGIYGGGIENRAAAVTLREMLAEARGEAPPC